MQNSLWRFAWAGALVHHGRIACNLARCRWQHLRICRICTKRTFSGNRLTGADVDAWFKSQGVGNSADKPKNPTEDFLQQKFQITANDALQWVIQHLDNPQAIYDVCANAGLNSQMLADIVQPHFTSVTLTGAVVNDWFAEQGIAALA